MLSPQAKEHIQHCRECMLLAEALNAAPRSTVAPKPAPSVIEAIRTNLKPVKQIRSAGFYFVLLLAVVVTLSAVAVYLNASVAGLRALGSGRASGMLGSVAIAIPMLAYLSTRLMVPGSRLRIGAKTGLVGSGLLILGAVVAMIPHTPHPHFVRSAWSCFVLGLPYGLASAAGIHLILRRGAPLSKHLVGMTAGLLGGLSGLAFLEIYCPLLDAGHVVMGHVAVPLFCGLLSVALSRWSMGSGARYS